MPSEYSDLPIYELAAIIEKSWGTSKVNYAARPYLDAMHSLNDITDNYYYDDGASVVSYFLSNASAWRGPVAREVKAELKRRLKTVYG